MNHPMERWVTSDVAARALGVYSHDNKVQGLTIKGCVGTTRELINYVGLRIVKIPILTSKKVKQVELEQETQV